MSDNVEVVCDMTRMSRLRGTMLLSMVPIVLAGLFMFPARASASTINLNGKAPGIQSLSSYPNHAMWVNTPTEFNVVPQGAKNGPIPGQVVSATTTYKSVTQPIYGQVAHQGQTWVNSGYWATGWNWVNSGYWATGWYWQNSGYWATGWYWQNSGYWAQGWHQSTGWNWVNSGYWVHTFRWVQAGYWYNGWHQVQGGRWVQGWGWRPFLNWPPPPWPYSRGGSWDYIPWGPRVWAWVWEGQVRQNYSYYVNTSHWQSYQYWWSYNYWVNTSHWQSYNYWVNTSHWQSYQYYVNTSHWQNYQYWVNTSHWQPYTYYTTEVVGYRTIQVPVVTTVTDSNINVSNESLLGVWSMVQNTSNGQQIYGGFCSTPTTPLIPPTSPGFPDYSGTPWDYSNFFGSQGICNLNASALNNGIFDNWAMARQSVQLIVTPSWSATVSYNQITTVDGVVTGSVPVTQTETISGTPYTGATIPTRYIVGVPCAIQNGRSYCPNGPAGGTPNP